jgi:23S rRNA pseudouridine2605 synthase
VSDAVRLQKFLAAAGVASRRKAEELILAGRVKVNASAVTELGTRIDPGKDLVTVDGKLVSSSEARAYYLLYKPSGCVTTASDPEGRPTALEYLRGVRQRVFPVGRLDWDAEGAVLFTDDGELANRLAHPRYGHRRTYLVKVRGEPDPQQLMRMTSGVRLEDGPAKALEANVHEHAEKNVWIRVVVGEGRFHLVKRLCESVGLQVQRLFRPEFGGVTVEGLRAGHFRPLSSAEVRQMRRLVGLEGGEAEAQKPVPRSLLPKAARRHGHGPPAPGGGDRPRVARPEGDDAGAPEAEAGVRRGDAESRWPRGRAGGGGEGVRAQERGGGEAQGTQPRGGEAGRRGGERGHRGGDDEKRGARGASRGERPQHGSQHGPRGQGGQGRPKGGHGGQRGGEGGERGGEGRRPPRR